MRLRDKVYLLARAARRRSASCVGVKGLSPARAHPSYEAFSNEASAVLERFTLLQVHAAMDNRQSIHEVVEVVLPI